MANNTQGGLSFSDLTHFVQNRKLIHDTQTNMGNNFSMPKLNLILIKLSDHFIIINQDDI